MTPGDEAPLLTFQWRDRDRPLVRLFLFTIVTVAGAAGFFMLFKVVYPQARHFSTAPQQVIMLDASQPVTRDIVNRTRDGNFLLLGAETAMDAPVGGASQFPVFRPGFAGFEMKLMDIPGEPDKKTLPRVFGIEDMHLPQIATVKKARPPVATDERATKPSVLRVVLHGELAARELAGQRDISGITLTDVTALRFRLCVNEAGVVTFALPVDGAVEAKQMRAVHKQVSGLRFKRAKSPAVQWGEASFVWENPSP